MALFCCNMERIEAIGCLEPGRLHITNLQYLTHNVDVALLRGHIQRRLAVLVLVGSQFPHELRIAVCKDPLDMGNITGPRGEVERRVAPLPGAVLAPPLLEALLLLHGQELEAPLLLYAPEALQFLQSAEPGAGLPLHLQIQEAYWGLVLLCDKVQILQDLVLAESSEPFSWLVSET